MKEITREYQHTNRRDHITRQTSFASCLPSLAKLVVSRQAIACSKNDLKTRFARLTEPNWSFF